MLPEVVTATRIWGIGVLWIVATSAGWSALQFVEGLAGETPALRYVVFLVAGCLLAGCQWIIIRRLCDMSFWWVPVTALGRLVGLWLCGPAEHLFGWVLPVRQYVWSWPLDVLVGATHGISQWALLRKYVAHSKWWVIATIVGYVAGWLWDLEAAEIMPQWIWLAPFDRGRGWMLGVVTAIPMMVWMNARSTAADDR